MQLTSPKDGPERYLFFSAPDATAFAVFLFFFLLDLCMLLKESALLAAQEKKATEERLRGKRAPRCVRCQKRRHWRQRQKRTAPGMQDPRERHNQGADLCAPEVSGFFDMTTLKTVPVSAPNATPMSSSLTPPPDADADNPQQTPSNDNMPLEGDNVGPVDGGAVTSSLTTTTIAAVEVAGTHQDPPQSDAAPPSGYDIFARLRVWSSAGASAERSLIMEGEEAHNDGSARKSATPAQDDHDADQAASLADPQATADDIVDDIVDDTPEHDDPSDLPNKSAMPTAVSSGIDSDTPSDLLLSSSPPPSTHTVGSGDADQCNDGNIAKDDSHQNCAKTGTDTTLLPRVLNKATVESVSPGDVHALPMFDGANGGIGNGRDEPKHAPAGGAGDTMNGPVAPPADVIAVPDLPPQDIPVHASNIVVPVVRTTQPSTVSRPPPRRWGPVAEAGWTAAALETLDAHVTRILADKATLAHVVVFAHGAGQSVPASIERFGADALLWAVSSAPAARTLQCHGCAVVKWPVRATHAAETASLSDLVSAVPWGRVNVVIDIGADRSQTLRARTLAALLPRLARGAVYACSVDCHQAALDLVRGGIAKTVHHHVNVIIVEAPAS